MQIIRREHTCKVEKTKLKGIYQIDDLPLYPSLYVPFQNAKLSDGQYLIVKNQTKIGSRMQEEIAIEVFGDCTEPLKMRSISGPHFHH